MEMNKEPELYEMFKSGSLPGSTIDYGTKKAEQMKADPSLFSEEVIETPEEGETREQFEERIRREAAEELQALINAETEKDPAEIIKKNKKGSYIHFKIKGKGNVIDELEKNEAIDKKLLRYLTVRVKEFDLETNYFGKKEDSEKKESTKN